MPRVHDREQFGKKRFFLSESGGRTTDYMKSQWQPYGVKKEGRVSNRGLIKQNQKFVEHFVQPRIDILDEKMDL